MYYFVKFTYKNKNDEMAKDPNLVWMPCEWMVKADSKDEAIKLIKEDIELDEVLEIREISAEERIQREQNKLFEMVKGDYLDRRYRGKTLREYNKFLKEMENDPELQYIAIKEFNAKQRLTRILSWQEGFDELTIAEANNTINQLIDAKDDEEFKKILHSIQKKK